MPAMGEALSVAQQAYEAFGRQDIPAFLNLVADEVDWKAVGPASLPHCSLRRNPAEVADFSCCSRLSRGTACLRAARIHRGRRERHGAGLSGRLCA